MAIIVEDGTGKSDAESFATVANADAYHLARGNTEWAALASETIKEQCLRRATDYMEQAYRRRWSGYRVSATQALSWPRSNAPIPDVNFIESYIPDDVVPTIVINACCEIALKAATTVLLEDQSQTVISETVGPLSVTYDKNSSQSVKYAAIDAALSSLFENNGMSIQIGIYRR